MQSFFSESDFRKGNPASALIPKCGACGLYKQCQSPKMPVYGRGAKGVLIIGEAPGESEDELGRPFVGKAGKVLRDILDGLGFSMDKDAWVTNSLICRPPKNKTPTDKQVSYCRPNVMQAITENEPCVIITLGRTALMSVIGGGTWSESFGSMERWVGWKMPSQRFNAWIVPTYHPSYIMRMKNDLITGLFRQHLETALETKKRPPKREDEDSRIDIVYDEDEVEDRLIEIDKAGGFSVVDYETNCLKPEHKGAAIYSCCVCGDDGRAISFPWVGKAIEATGKFLRSKSTKKIAANLKMEERWTLKEFGHPVRGWFWDTMIAAHVLDGRKATKSLKFQAFVRLGVSSYNAHIENLLKTNKKGDRHLNRIDEINTQDLLRYGGMDGILELDLARIQMKELGYV